MGVVCLIGILLAAIDFEVGARGGVPVSSALMGQYSGPVQMVYGVTLPFSGYRPVNRRYALGPSVTAGLTRRFSLQWDALYRRYGFDSALPVINTPSSGAWAREEWVRVSQWNHSGQLRYRWGRLLAGAGATLHRVGVPEVRYRSTRRGLFDREPFVGVGTSSIAQELRYRNGYGVVASGGLVWKVGWLRIHPELRYTRMTRLPFRGEGPGGSIQTRVHQWEVLIGVLAATR